MTIEEVIERRDVSGVDKLILIVIIVRNGEVSLARLVEDTGVSLRTIQTRLTCLINTRKVVRSSASVGRGFLYAVR